MPVQQQMTNNQTPVSNGRQRARRIGYWLLVTGHSLLLCAPASAQIFPRIEKEEVRKRIQSGKDDTPPPADKDEGAPPPTEVDGAKVLARYRELLDAYKRDEKAFKESIERQTADMHVAVRDYMEGVLLLRLGQYREADIKLGRVGFTPKKDEAKSDGQRTIIEDIKSGRAYHFRMIAVAMQYWDDFKDEEALNAAWAKARRNCDKVVADVRKQRAPGAEERATRMNAWLVNAPVMWRTAWSALQNAEKHPDNPNTWKKLATATGVPEEASEDFTPMYFVQRAALEVLIQFWPKDAYVTGGFADVTLGFNYIAMMQTRGWEALIEPQPYHTDGGKNTLAAGKTTGAAYVRLLNQLKEQP
jgi:hypothetical protein